MNRGAQELGNKLMAHGAKAKLAKALGIGQDRITRWLAGTHKPMSKARALIQKLHGVQWTHWDEDIPIDRAPPERRRAAGGRR